MVELCYIEEKTRTAELLFTNKAEADIALKTVQQQWVNLGIPAGDKPEGMQSLKEMLPQDTLYRLVFRTNDASAWDTAAVIQAILIKMQKEITIKKMQTFDENMVGPARIYIYSDETGWRLVVRHFLFKHPNPQI